MTVDAAARPARAHVLRVIPCRKKSAVPLRQAALAQLW
jgi:hypothetical protein